MLKQQSIVLPQKLIEQIEELQQELNIQPTKPEDLDSAVYELTLKMNQPIKPAELDVLRAKLNKALRSLPLCRQLAWAQVLAQKVEEDLSELIT